MNRILLASVAILAFFVLPFTCFAQQWQWGTRAQNQAKEIVVDNHGNMYVLWPVGDQANIDGHPIATHGYTDMALTSFRCDGTYRWTKVIGGSSPDAGFGLGTDTLGGVYLLGYVASSSVNTIYVDADTVIDPTSRKIVLIKYDTTGDYKWLRMPEPVSVSAVSNNAGFNLTVTPDGDAHVMAILTPGTYGDGAFTATYPDSQNIYVLKYDKDGDFTGGLHLDITRTATAGISSYGFTMMYDPVTSRYFWNGIRFDPYTLSLGSTAITGPNFLVCFSNTGSVDWIQKSNNDAIPTQLMGKPAIDNSGNVYVTGWSYNDFNGGIGDGFGNYDFNNTMGVWAFPILVKFDASGNVLYAKNASDNMDNAGLRVAYSNGVIGLIGQYAGGNFDWGGIPLGTNNEYYDNFLARFDAATGNILTIDTIPSGPMANEYPTVLTTDKFGNFYVGGEYDDNIIITGNTYYKQDGYTDGYIAKYATGSCNCIAPLSAFSHTGTALTDTFTYNGTTPVDSVVWSFGDNQSASGLTVYHTFTVPDTFTICATAYNSCGSNQSCSDLIVTSGVGTGISGLAETFPGINTYPNPVSDILHIQGLTGETRFEIYNSIGSRVQDGILAANYAEIKMQLLPAGLYNLHLYDKHGHSGQMKIIRQ